MPAVKPEIMKWARDKAGMSLEEAAHALGVHNAHGKTGAERLAALEAGNEEPSRRFLQNMAHTYHRSLLIFYLEAPPKQGDRGQDFRLAPNAGPPAYDATLDILLRDIKSRQRLVRSLLEDEDALPIPFVGSATMGDGPSVLAEQIAGTLSFQLTDFRSGRSLDDAFSYLRARIEGAGIFLLLAGNLGSHHSNIPADIFRGFAISDPIAPFVVINDQDARAAWSFTALHEVAHIWLGATGVSGAAAGTALERFCNDVASEMLLPASDLREIASVQSRPFNEAVERITAFAAPRKISPSMVAYKLLRSEIIGEGRWLELKSLFQQGWLERAPRSHNEDDRSRGGPSYYVVRRHRLGPALLRLISRSLGAGAITPTKAGQVLGVKPRNVAPLLRDISPQGSA